jgi:hypothetical protein
MLPYLLQYIKLVRLAAATVPAVCAPMQWRSMPQDRRPQQLQPAKQRQQHPASMPQDSKAADGSASIAGLDQQQQAKLQGLVQQLALQPRRTAGT